MFIIMNGQTKILAIILDTLIKRKIYEDLYWGILEKPQCSAQPCRKFKISWIRGFDFTDPHCRKTHVTPPEMFPEQFDPDIQRYSEYINRQEWRTVVNKNREVVALSDHG